MKPTWIRGLIYFVCMGAAAVLLLAFLLGPVVANRPVKYASSHPASTVAPMVGFSAESLVNTGDARALDTLPGIGEVIAQRMIDTRVLLGGFRIPEDLLLVKGIGEKTLDKIMAALDEALVTLQE